MSQKVKKSQTTKDEGELLVKEYRINSVWIEHGALAAAASVFTTAVTGFFSAIYGAANALSGGTSRRLADAARVRPTALVHRWVEIETCNPHVWYIAHFNGDMDLVLEKCRSRGEVDRVGMQAAGDDMDKEITIRKIWSPKTHTTMNDVRGWIDRYDDDFDVLTNNSDHLVDAFYDHFKRKM